MGATILQNGLKANLPVAFKDMFIPSAQGVDLAYAIIPSISSLPEPLGLQVKVAFAKSLRTMWFAMLALCIIGAICVVGMKEIKMHEITDDEWGMEDRQRKDPQAGEKV